MNIEIDKNNLLTIFNENIPQTKEYTYNVSGYLFSDYDKGIIVLHKKEWKLINLKNFGDNMSIVYVKKGKTEMQNKKFDEALLHDAIKVFQGFDEETGKKYYFIPGLGDTQQQEKNKVFKALGTACEIKKTDKRMIIETNKKEESNSIGKLFGLLLLYGKFDTKNNELVSIKIQIPLFGQYLAQQEILDEEIKNLQNEGIFLKTDKLQNKNGIVYQISSNDYELLEIFAKWYEPVEKFEKITKREFTQEMKIKLIEFLQSNPEIPSEGKNDVITQIQAGTIKLLTK